MVLCVKKSNAQVVQVKTDHCRQSFKPFPVLVNIVHNQHCISVQTGDYLIIGFIEENDVSFLPCRVGIFQGSLGAASLKLRLYHRATPHYRNNLGLEPVGQAEQ